MDLAILLYTISDDKLRDEFTAQLEAQGFENHPDQSTYTYPQNKVGEIFNIGRFTKWLEEWSKNKPWDNEDFISIYYLAKISDNSQYTAIKNQYFKKK